MLDIDAILRPWWDSIQAAHGPLELYDAHTHIGPNDPDGFKQTPEELIDVMARADARAVVFPMHEPDGYPGPNDVAIAAAAESDRLVAFCRLDPRDHPASRGAPLPRRGRGRHQAAPARRAVRDGRAGRARDHRHRARAQGAGAHPRRPRHPRARARPRCELSAEFPDARFILAHAAISDLAWLWHVLPEHPNVFIDTAWWNPADLIALFALVDAVADRVGERLAVRAADRRRVHARALRAAGGRVRRGAALDHGRPDGAARRGRGPGVGRRARRAPSSPRCTRCSTASSRT